MTNSPGAFGQLASAVGDAGGVIAALDMRSASKNSVVRDVTVNVTSDATGKAVREAVEGLDGVRIISVSDSTFLAH
ncbi:MAG: NAD-dependent malic enzyme, partial [Candidatus Eremiobacteraeota bacterium]|nr:NAD-dependent malic enzyme [Candidatus Eremiobacteraeota bacterium]